MQYMQQAIRLAIYEDVKRDNLLSHFISFDDQAPNQRMALKGSLDGSLATLDLSEASDRVSNQHVRALMARWPLLAEAVDATRSRKADVDGYGVIRLAKFASMGSALTFPIEAMVFLTVVMMGIEDVLKRQLTSRDLLRLRGSVRIFGDDIIVPKEYALSVVSRLEAFGLKVNGNKSFWTGRFRESCVKEYYAGHDVSIVKVRRVLPSQREHVSEIISLVETRNQFYKSGLWTTTRYLDNIIERLIPFPAVAETSPGLGRFSFLGYETQKWSRDLQAPLVKAYVPHSQLPISQLDDYGALLKFFLKRGELPFADRDHLERAGRPKRVNIKLRMVQPF